MTIAYWTVLFAALLPLVWVGIAKSGAAGYDNHAPRPFLAGLEGWPQRANWAQMNALEAFPPFAAAVIIAHLSGGEQWLVDTLAGLFIVARILHGIFYILDKATLRSLSWLAGFLCVLGLFLSGS